MPVPTTTAIRSGSTPASPAPEPRPASSAARTATCWLRSSRRARTRSICSAGSAASRATSWAGKSLIQSSVIRLTPDRPASRASQVVATSPPRGVVAPSPVTTTSVADVLMGFLLGLRPGGRWSATLQGPPPSVQGVGEGRSCYWFFSMKLMASPTVLMLPSSSSGMATPNLSSTAVAISTMDRESTSRSSVNDFSGGGSAGGTPAASSRISASPAWISWVLANVGSSLGRWRRPWWSAAVVRDGCPGGRWVSREAQDLPGEGQPGAVAEHQCQIAGLGLARLEQRREGQGDRGRGRVAGLDDVAGDDGALGQAELPGHRLDDAQGGLVGSENVDVLRADPG